MLLTIKLAVSACNLTSKSSTSQSQNVLMKTINHSKLFDTIHKEEVHNMLSSRQSFLFMD